MIERSAGSEAMGFLDLSTDMGRRVSAYDWASTSLGPIEDWPSALKIAVGLVLRSGFAKCLCWGPDQLTIYNDAFVPILGGKANCLGQPCSTVWQEAWDRIAPITARAMAGSATFLRDFRISRDRPDRGTEDAFFTFSYSPIVDEHGSIQGYMHTVIETTDRVRFERKASVSNRELVHRMKNSYALISAIVGQIARTSETKDELRHKLTSHLVDLGHAQEFLTLRKGSEASIAEVVCHTVARLGEKDRYLCTTGPEVLLNEAETFALSLALNELATNSIKYGALSSEPGRVNIDWHVIDGGGDSSLFFSWQEEGGPPVAPPTRTGFGSFLIKQMLAAEFGGEVTLDYAPEGLRVFLECRRS